MGETVAPADSLQQDAHRGIFEERHGSQGKRMPEPAAQEVMLHGRSYPEEQSGEQPAAQPSGQPEEQSGEQPGERLLP